MRNLCFIFCLFGLLTSAYGQKGKKGSFKDVMVIEFLSPYETILVDLNGRELSLPLNQQCKVTGKKRKALSFEDVTPTSIVEVEFELERGRRIVTQIKTTIDADGQIDVSGVFEGMESQEVALLDGYRVRLGPEAYIEAGRGARCDCPHGPFPSFTDQLIQAGNYFVEAQGRIGPDGVLEIEEAKACQNDYSSADRELREAVENSFSASGLAQVGVPKDFTLPIATQTLSNGNIVIGQYAYPLHPDLMLQGYVNSIGESLVPDYQRNMPAGDPNKIDFRFYVIDDPVPNAFAFPNGMIFVHTGILQIMESEAELAVVLGHEIAHVTHEHGRERYEKNALVGDGLELFNDLFGNTLQRWTSDLNLSDDLRLSLTDTYSALRPEALANVLSPQPARESQADRVGLQYALLAGYDIREAVHFWNKMRQLTAEPSFKNEMTGHLTDMLRSDQFRGSNSSLLDRLGSVGIGTLSNMFLDTIYTSHPKAKARAQALNQMLITVYPNENYERLRKQEDSFQQYVLDVI